MLTVAILSVVMLNVATLSVVTLSVVMLNVVSPAKRLLLRLVPFLSPNLEILSYFCCLTKRQVEQMTNSVSPCCNKTAILIASIS